MGETACIVTATNKSLSPQKGLCVVLSVEVVIPVVPVLKSVGLGSCVQCTSVSVSMLVVMVTSGCVLLGLRLVLLWSDSHAKSHCHWPPHMSIHNKRLCSLPCQQQTPMANQPYNLTTLSTLLHNHAKKTFGFQKYLPIQ